MSAQSTSSPEPTNRSPLTHVALVGDSLTEGYRSQIWHPLESYPAQLQAMLGPSYVLETFATRLSSALTGEHTLPFVDGEGHARDPTKSLACGCGHAGDQRRHQVISRQCDAIAPECLPEFLAPPGDPCRHGAQTNTSSAHSPYEVSLLSLVAAFRANNRAHEWQDPRILLVVPPPLLANIGIHTPGCTIAPHPLNATAAMLYLPTSIHAVASQRGESILPHGCALPCRYATPTARLLGLSA